MDRVFVRASVLRPTGIQGAGEVTRIETVFEDVSTPYLIIHLVLAGTHGTQGS